MEINQNFAIYRPVSLTCIICKLMEKEVRNYLLDHVWAITSSAFLKGRSTVLQLLRIHVMDEWTECLERGGQINAIYTDFEKAFGPTSASTTKI